MSSRVPQSLAELEQHLQDHLGFLRSSADAYDEGRDGEAKRLAVSLRVLLHDTNQSISLLGQLDRLTAKFLSTANPLRQDNLVPHSGLIFMVIGGSDTYLAMLDNVPVKNWVEFPTWWSEPVFVDDKVQKLSRRQLVLAVANQDGGAHVDPTLTETYARLSRHNSLGWVISDGTTTTPIKKPERAAIRQIAHEVLVTLTPGYSKVAAHKVGVIAGGFSLRKGATIPTVPKSQKIGRNEPCPCGSGQKYKRCHGAIAT